MTPLYLTKFVYIRSWYRADTKADMSSFKEGINSYDNVPGKAIKCVYRVGFFSLVLFHLNKHY